MWGQGKHTPVFGECCALPSACLSCLPACLLVVVACQSSIACLACLALPCLYLSYVLSLPSHQSVGLRVVLWCCGAVVAVLLWCCGAVVLWCCGGPKLRWPFPPDDLDGLGSPSEGVAHGQLGHLEVLLVEVLFAHGLVLGGVLDGQRVQFAQHAAEGALAVAGVLL